MSDLDCYVYRIDDLNGTPRYVGAGCNRRWLRHKKQSHNARLAELVAAGGARPPVKVAEGLTKAEALAAECEFIALYGREDLGRGTLFNLTSGGAGATGCVPSAEQCAKISASRLGQKLSPATRAKISSAQLGKKRGPRSAETRAKIGEGHRGKKRGPLSPATIAKRTATRARNRLMKPTLQRAA